MIIRISEVQIIIILCYEIILILQNNNYNKIIIKIKLTARGEEV